jgi:hypothetical protein
MIAGRFVALAPSAFTTVKTTASWTATIAQATEYAMMVFVSAKVVGKERLAKKLHV